METQPEQSTETQQEEPEKELEKQTQSDDFFVIRTNGFFRRMFRRRYRCGHKDHRDFVLVIYNKAVAFTSLQLMRRGKCGDCLLEEYRQEAIRCALCGDAILPWENVGLLNNADTDPAWTTRVGLGERAVVCARCDSKLPRIEGQKTSREIWTGRETITINWINLKK